MYALGGVTKKEFSSGRCERFNLESKTWQSLPMCSYNRINPKMCASFNSKLLYAFGGVPDNKDANKRVEFLNTETMEWHPLGVILPLEFKG